MPTQVLNHARHALSALEAHAESAQAQVDLFAAPPAVEPPPVSAVDKAMAAIDPDTLSPRDALELVYKLKKMHSASSLPSQTPSLVEHLLSIPSSIDIERDGRPL